MRTDPFKPYEKPLELVFPCENSFYGAETFFKNRKIEHRLASTFGLLPVPLIGLDVGFHARIEDLLAVCMAIIDAIKAHGRSFKIEPYSFCNALPWAHCFPYQGGLVSVARCTSHRRNDIAVTITYGDNLVTLHVLMAVVA